MVWPSTKRHVLLAIGTVIVLLILIFIGVWLWGVLSGYIQPKTPTDKRALVKGFVVIASGMVATLTAIAAVGNLIDARRNLQNHGQPCSNNATFNRRAQDGRTARLRQ